MNDPFDKLTGPIDNIGFFWIISFFIVALIVIFNLKPRLQEEWDVKYQFSQDFYRSIMPTLVRMHSAIDGGSVQKIASVMREEMCINASIIHNKGISYFFKYRTNQEIMRKYFDNQELLIFFVDPKLWILNFLNLDKSVLHYSIENKKAEHVLSNFHRLLKLYRECLYFTKIDAPLS